MSRSNFVQREEDRRMEREGREERGDDKSQLVCVCVCAHMGVYVCPVETCTCMRVMYVFVYGWPSHTSSGQQPSCM